MRNFINRKGKCMKEKPKALLSIVIIALICLALPGPLTTQARINETVTVEPSNSGTWTIVSSSPYIWDYAVGVTAAGDSIYIANSRTSDWESKFMRYNTSTSQWNMLSVPLQSFKNSIAEAWDNGNYIYALLGASYTDITNRGGRFYFYRYNIVSNTWTQLQSTPHTNGAGDALCFVPGWVLGYSDDNFLYAILGSKDTSSNSTLSGSKFYCYNITSNSWSSPLSFPWDRTDDGCSLVWTGDNYLYALRGEYLESTACKEFWRYDIMSNSWVQKADIPADPWGEISGTPGVGGVGDGGSLLWIGGGYSDYIYALSGNQAYPEPIWDNRTYRYTISTNTWERLADLPKGVGDQNGPRLGFANGKIYCWRGTYKDGQDGSLYAYQLDFSPPEITIISPENKTYRAETVPLTFTVNESTSWMGYSLDGQENETITGNTTLTNLNNGSHNIIIHANDTSGNMGSSSKVYFTTSSPIHNLTLVTLYIVHLELNETFSEGSNLTVIFYSYMGEQEANTTIGSTTPPDVDLIINITHPLNGAVKNAILVLTDASGNIIRTVTSFIVCRSDLIERIIEIDTQWIYASGEERSILFKEIIDIDFQWPYAPP